MKDQYNDYQTTEGLFQEGLVCLEIAADDYVDGLDRSADYHNTKAIALALLGILRMYQNNEATTGEGGA